MYLFYQCVIGYLKCLNIIIRLYPKIDNWLVIVKY